MKNSHRTSTPSSKSEETGDRPAVRAQGGPKHAPRVPFAVLVTALVIGGMALLLVLNTASAANELRRRDLVQRDADVAAQVQELRNQVAASAAPAQLAAAAAGLGMVPANNPAFLVLAAGGAVKVMGKPAPATAAPIAAPYKKKKKKKPVATTSSAHPTSSSTSTNSTPTSGNSAAKTAVGTSTSARSATRTAGTSSSATSPPAGPKPTPTPIVTLPGGDR